MVLFIINYIVLYHAILLQQDLLHRAHASTAIRVHTPIQFNPEVIVIAVIFGLIITSKVRGLCA